MPRQNYSQLEYDQIALGQNGFDVLTDETATAGAGDYTAVSHWVAIMVDSSVATITATTKTGSPGDSLPSGVRSEGRVIFGEFSAITVDSAGQVIAYRGV